MTKGEALIYLPLQSNVELIDIYELELFSFKQYFIQKPPLTKLFSARLKRLIRINEAFIALGGELEKETFNFQLPTFTNNVRETINQFFKSQNQIKLAIQQAGGGVLIVKIIQTYLGLMRLYVRAWGVSGIDNVEGVKVVQELNPMELMAAVDDFESLGKELFTEINQMNEKHLLFQEAKRLYLWNKLDENVR